jgi:hypothetical protein
VNAEQAADGLHRLEGYLLAQAERDTARREAEAFARRLPWLTTAEREQLVECYARERIALSHRVLAGVADRCRTLQAEYGERYERLRCRLVCLTVLVLAGVALPLTLVLLRLLPATGA